MRACELTQTCECEGRVFCHFSCYLQWIERDGCVGVFCGMRWKYVWAPGGCPSAGKRRDAGVPRIQMAIFLRHVGAYDEFW